jgi:hypothetical protein
MKKLLKILGILAIILVIGLVAAIIAIRQAFPPEKIKALVEEQATKTLHRGVSVGDAGFSLWPLGLSLKDIKVANNPSAGFSKDPMLDLPLAVVKIDLLKLFQLQVAVDKISIENLSLLYEVMPDGRTSIDGLGGEPSTAAKDTAKLDLSKIELPGSLSLNSFIIKKAKVVFNDVSQKRKIILGDINLSMGLSLDRTLEDVRTATVLALNEISLEDAGLGVRKGGISVFLNADINANLRLQHINIQNLSTGLQSVNIKASGTVDRFMESIKMVNLKIETNNIDLANVLKDIPAGINPEIPKVKASGNTSLNVAIKGAVTPKKSPPLNGNLILNNIAVSHSDLPSGIKALTGNIVFTENSVSIKPLTFLLAEQPTNILLDASDLLSPRPMLNNLTVKTSLDLGVLFALANKLISIKELSHLAGKIEATVGARGILDPARPENFSVNGDISLQNIVAKTPLIPDAVSANGTVQFSNTEISVDPAVQIGKSNVRVKVLAKDYLAMVMPRLAAGKKMNINIDVNSSNLELDRLLPPGDPNKKPEEEGPPMEQYPELPDIVANINISLANTVFRYLTMSNFNMGIKYANKRANIAGGGQFYTGSFNTNAAVDLSNRKSADVKFALNVNRVEANDFITNANNNVSGNSEMAKQIRDLDNTVFGKFSMNMNVSTKGLPQNFVDNLNGPISVEIINGSLRGSKILSSVGSGISNFEVAGKKVLSSAVPINSKGDVSFDDLKAEFEAKNGQLLVKNLKINARSLGLLAFTGGVGFDGTLNLKLQNTLSPSVSSNLNNLTKASPISLYAKDGNGNALLFFNIGGTFSDPKVTLDASKNENPLNNLKDAATAKVSEAKDAALAKKKEMEDRAKAEVEAKKKEAENKAKAKANEQKQKAANTVKDKAKDALKGFRK